MIKGARSSAFVALLVIVAGLAIAACGSSNTTQTTAAAAGGAATTATAGHRFGLTATERSCLSSHGVTLPTGRFGRHFGGTGTGTFTGPNGTPPTGGYPGAGGGGYPGPGAGGAPGAGGGFGGGGGFFGAGRGSKFASAFKACGIKFGGFGGGGLAGGAGRYRPSATAIKAFVACVDAHGYKLTGVNTSGSGPVLTPSLETNKKFLAAARYCISDLRTTPAAGAAGGSSGS